MGKRRRADAAAVSAENEKTQFTCVELTLNKWLRGDTLSTHKQLKSALENTVQVVNQAVAEAWLLANLRILLCHETSGDRELILRKIGPLDQTFFSRRLANHVWLCTRLSALATTVISTSKVDVLV